MPPTRDVFTIKEIARAAGVPAGQVRAWAEAERVTAFRGFVRQADAVSLVRNLAGSAPEPVRHRPLFGLLPGYRRRKVTSLFASGGFHGLLIAFLALLASVGLLTENRVDRTNRPNAPIRFVFLDSPGPGGGGGGGGLRTPAPPPPARTSAPKPEPLVTSMVAPPIERPLPPAFSVVVPRRFDPPASARIDVPRPESVVMEPAPPSLVVQAPIASPPNSAISAAGLPSAQPAPLAADLSHGPGTGGGLGSGTGPGAGSGAGAGVGPGSGGGAGGGVFRPGTGIEPPVLLREVKPLYTDDARKRAIEGDVVLEVVVRQDGSVGTLHVTHGLGAGLEQKAIEAVRQWRFGPARRQGVPVDVVVEVSVEFKLR